MGSSNQLANAKGELVRKKRRISKRRFIEVYITYPVLAPVNTPEELEPEEGQIGQATQSRSDTEKMPLTTALLAIAAKGISFATPGHRCGRSYDFSLKLEGHV
jgi:hypothetical protein